MTYRPSPTAKLILMTLKEKGPMSKLEIASACDASIYTVTPTMHQLVHEGLVARSVVKNKAFYAVPETAQSASGNPGSAAPTEK
jgi:predicted ArsR family transcriptional regulator